MLRIELNNNTWSKVNEIKLSREEKSSLDKKIDFGKDIDFDEIEMKISTVLFVDKNLHSDLQEHEKKILDDIIKDSKINKLLPHIKTANLYINDDMSYRVIITYKVNSPQKESLFFGKLN